MGNFNKSFNDLSVQAPGYNVSFDRTYNSMNNSIGVFGRGWTFSFAATCKDYQYKFVDSNGVTQSASLANIKTVQLPDGSNYIFEYQNGVYVGANTRETLVKNADNTFTFTSKSRVKYVFNPNGNLVSITDANSNTIKISVDANGNPVLITDSVNRQYSIGYTNGLISSITDPMGRVITYEYTNGQLTCVKDQSGAIINTYEYDSSNYLTKVKDAFSNVLQAIVYNHDAGANQNRVVSITDDKGVTNAYTYDNDNNKTTQTDSSNNQIINTYDKFMRLISTQDSTGTKTTTYYNLYGDVNTETEVNGDTTQYQYDSNGNVVTITYTKSGAQTTETYTYDSNNNVLRKKSADNKMTYYQYDQNGNLLKQIEPKNGTDVYTETSNAADFDITSYTYSLNGLVATETQKDGITIMDRLQ